MMMIMIRVFETGSEAAQSADNHGDFGNGQEMSENMEDPAINIRTMNRSFERSPE